MSAIADWHSTLKESGTAVPVTGEACSFVSGSDPAKVYQVTSSSRRIWDPTVAVVVKDGGSTVSSTQYSFDYLFGIVTFSAHAAVGAITVDGSYLPTVAVATVRKHGLKLTREQLDDSSYDDQDGWRRFIVGLLSGSVTFEALDKLSNTHDSVSGGQFTYLKSSTPKVIEIGDGSGYWRIWVKAEDLEESGEVAGLVTGSMTWRATANSGATASYGT